MPCVIKRKKLVFKIAEVYCAEEPYEVDDVDYMIFYHTRRRNPEFYCREIHAAVLDLRPSLDEIFEGFSANLRKDIRRAYRDGIITRVNEGYGEFHRLAIDFHRAKGLPLSLVPPIEFMQRNGYLLTAYIGGRLVAGQFYMACSPTLLYHTASRIISVNPRENQVIGRAVKALVWEAVKLAKLKGYQELNLGGISERMDTGIDFFKLRYGAKLQVQYVCKKANNPVLSILLMGRKLAKHVVKGRSG
jgi:hypothetical protein